MRLKNARNNILRKVCQGLFSSNSVLFKCLLLFTMCLNLATYNVLTASSRQDHSPGNQYFPTTVVLLSEIVKLVVSLMVVFYQSDFRPQRVSQLLQREILSKPKEFSKLMLPAAIYALQNNLVYVVLSNMEPTMYQVLSHMKIFTTALFMRFLLGYALNGVQWAALFMLFCGVALVEVGNAQPVTFGKDKQNYLLGIVLIAVIAVCSGFAGVYFEKQLKQNSVPFWMRNISMYTCGILSSGFCLLAQEGTLVSHHGFFFGYSPLVIVIVLLEGAGGLYVSLVMRYLDNIFKTFASAVGILLTALFSSVLFSVHLFTPSFLMGTALVCASVFLYTTKAPQHTNELPREKV